MPARPSITVKRPTRSSGPIGPSPTPIEPTAIPTVDPESADALAFSLRGRGNTASDTGEAKMHGVLPAVDPPRPTISAPKTPDAPTEGWLSGLIDVGHVGTLDGNEPGQGLISIKVPPDIGRQLAAIADRRGSKRTLIAIEALSEPLQTLAAAHRAGDFPELPRVVSGTVRLSIAFALPPDLAADLEFVLKARRAVRAQVITRLLAPAVRALYDSEVVRRSR